MTSVNSGHRRSALSSTDPDDRRAPSIRATVADCSLGAVLVAASRGGICAILLGDESEALMSDLLRRFPAARRVAGDGGLDRLAAKVVDFIETPAHGLDHPLDMRGTDFQLRVWRALREIPPGATASYADVARRIGSPRAVRAVARACAANMLAVAVPCHRVVRRDHALAGYRWGVERKRRLLDREAAA